jgi:hypothetical protein
MPFGEACARRAIELVFELMVAPEALVVDATDNDLLMVLNSSLEDREFKFAWQGMMIYLTHVKIGLDQSGAR